MKRGKKRILTLAAALFLVVLVHTFIGMIVVIPADGEHPLLCAGDRVWVSRMSFGLRMPLSHLFGYKRLYSKKVQRGTWLVYNDPTQRQEPRIEARNVCVGYAMALPGDTVWMAEDGTVSPCRDAEKGCVNAIMIPRAGHKVYVTPWSLRFYQRLIQDYPSVEANTDGTHLTVNGKRVSVLRFDRDYYWISSGNPDNYHDSRSQGLIPESHLIGAVKTIVFSLPPENPWYAPFDSGRFFRPIPAPASFTD